MLPFSKSSVFNVNVSPSQADFRPIHPQFVKYVNRDDQPNETKLQDTGITKYPATILNFTSGDIEVEFTGKKAFHKGDDVIVVRRDAKSVRVVALATVAKVWPEHVSRSTVAKIDLTNKLLAISIDDEVYVVSRSDSPYSLSKAFNKKASIQKVPLNIKVSPTQEDFHPLHLHLVESQQNETKLGRTEITKYPATIQFFSSAHIEVECQGKKSFRRGDDVIILRGAEKAARVVGLATVIEVAPMIEANHYSATIDLTKNLLGISLDDEVYIISRSNSPYSLSKAFKKKASVQQFPSVTTG
jgi:hypothetical protein